MNKEKIHFTTLATISPTVPMTPQLAKLIPYAKNRESIDFWKQLILYVVPDSSFQSYRATRFGSVILKHHIVGDNSFELFKDGSIRGSANFMRIMEFFEAAGVVFDGQKEKTDKVYTLIAYQNGSAEKHSYTVASTDDLDVAKVWAEHHCQFRGGIYGVVVYECPMNIIAPDFAWVAKEVHRVRSRAETRKSQNH